MKRKKRYETPKRKTRKSGKLPVVKKTRSRSTKNTRGKTKVRKVAPKRTAKNKAVFRSKSVKPKNKAVKGGSRVRGKKTKNLKGSKLRGYKRPVKRKLQPRFTGKGKQLSKKVSKPIKKKATGTLRTREKYSYNENTLNHNGTYTLIFPAKTSFLNKVRFINKWDAKQINPLLNKAVKRPRAFAVILKIKKPGEPGYFYTTELSPPDMVPNAENIQAFTASVVSDYNNTYAELAENYDEPVKPYDVKEVTIRIIY